jgi:hypothetical protein
MFHGTTSPSDGGSNQKVKTGTLILAILCLLLSWHHANRFSSAVSVGLHAGIASGSRSDLYPVWNGTRAILQGRNPYSVAVAEQNQIATYGNTASALHRVNQYWFAYPIFATFPIMPLALLKFRMANELAFWAFVALIVLSVKWCRGVWNSTTVLYAMLALSTYPIIYALQSRQVTVLFFALLAAALGLLRSGRLIAAAILVALALGKPQLGLAVALPLLIWSVADWNHRKRFVAALAVSSLALIGLGLVISPGWIPAWLDALREYSRYARPSLVTLAAGRIAPAISLLLLVGLMMVLWRIRKSDVAFQVAVSVTFLQLLVPYEPYNEVMLIIPVLWIFDHALLIASYGAGCQITLAALRIALIGGWATNVLGAALWHTSAFGQSIAWQLPGVVILPLLASVVAAMAAVLLSSGALLGLGRSAPLPISETSAIVPLQQQ